MARARSKRKGNTKAEARRRRRERDTRSALPRMGHETMLGIAFVKKAVEALTRQLQVPVGEEPALVDERALADCPEVDEMTQSRYQVCKQALGYDHEACMIDLQQLLTHTQCAANFELAGRKAFWIGAELAEQLGQTDLDVSGDALFLPFAACAFCFTDPATLELVAAAATTAHRFDFKVLTVYAAPTPEDQGGDGLRFVFLADCFDGEWPYMIARDVVTDGARNIDEILDSHPEGSEDPFFRTPALKALVKLVINVVLYTTSSSFESERLAPLPRSRAAHSARPLTGETVFYLPGRVPIDHSPRESALAEGSDERATQRRILKRFWVRGHWRRPNPSWSDQRLRWVQPYLKGPDATVVIERQYQVGPRAAPS